jgi:ribosomal protein L25 (general stress protein Ctc)
MVKQREEGGTQLGRALRREAKLRAALYKERQNSSNLVQRYTDIMVGDDE